jgi:hypothetical protein
VVDSKHGRVEVGSDGQRDAPNVCTIIFEGSVYYEMSMTFRKLSWSFTDGIWLRRGFGGTLGSIHTGSMGNRLSTVRSHDNLALMLRGFYGINQELPRFMSFNRLLDPYTGLNSPNAGAESTEMPSVSCFGRSFPLLVWLQVVISNLMVIQKARGLMNPGDREICFKTQRER